MFDRRMFLLGGACAFAASCTFDTGGIARNSKKRPNVLMLAIDDLNSWPGAINGQPATKTPNIDRLAQRATTFTNAHASAPLCGPSRASIMTGLLPSTTGIYGHVKDDLSLIHI